MVILFSFLFCNKEKPGLKTLKTLTVNLFGDVRAPLFSYAFGIKPRGVLRISSDGDDRRIFLGMKFSILGFFFFFFFGGGGRRVPPGSSKQSTIFFLSLYRRRVFKFHISRDLLEGN